MEAKQANLSIGRNLKISLFHLGSGMADVLMTGIWNRIMIADLGFGATIVGLLTGLRYFLAPLGVWAGRVSDRRTVGGYRRLFWVWLGRAMMVLSTLSLGFATSELVAAAQNGITGTASPGIWAVMIISFLLFSLGNAISGSTFLALVYDRAPEHQRGRAVGIVWTFLLLGFTIGGIFFGLMLPHKPDAEAGTVAFSADSVMILFLVSAIVLGAIWFFSLLGEEKRGKQAISPQAHAQEKTSIRHDLQLVWQSRTMRFFLFYLVLSMLFAFLQDTILEPFAGEVFGMEARITNRFSAYWGSMAIIGSFLFLYLSRRYRYWTNEKMSIWGVIALIIAFAIFAISSLAQIRGLVTPGLIVLGIGLGIWNIGTLGLMMDMSPLGRAGTFLGFWSMAVTFARGFGVAGGGIVRDIALAMSNSFSMAYGIAFVLGFIGLCLSLYALIQVNIKSFKKDMDSERDTAAILAGAMD